MTYTRLPIRRLGDVFLGKMLQPERKAVDDVAAPYLRAAHIQPRGQIVEVDDKAMWFSPADLEKHDLRACDVVVVEGGAGYGRAAVLTEDRDGWGFQNSVVRVRPRPGRTDGRFLAFALQAALDAGEIEVACFTATIPHFTADKVSAFPVPAPRFEEQCAIADYLDRETAQIDTLIKEQQRLVELLSERRRALIRRSLTPSHDWTHARVKHVATTTLGKMLDAGRNLREGDEPAPYVRAADVLADGRVNLTDLNEMPFSPDEMQQYDLSAGDVLLIEGGATVGRPGFVLHDTPGVAFQKTVNRLRVSASLDSRFTYWSFVALYEADHYSRYYGSVSFVHLTAEKLREIELAHPALAEQRRIAAYIDEQTAKVDELIAETQRFIALSRERRAALITAAVTGQIDVRGEAE